MFRVLQTKRRFQNDEGAALAMVLVFIAFLALWMAALAVLIQTSSASLAKNAEENTRRANLVNSVLPLAISEINYPKRLGMDEDFSRCSEFQFRDNESKGVLSFTVNSVQKGVVTPEKILVQCTQSVKSGLTQPIASFFLTGGAQAGGVTGVDGGLKLDPTSSVKLTITGGITNVSGAWSNVNASTLELKKVCANPEITDVTQCEGDPAPQIVQPSPTDNQCPALKFDVASCECPIWYSANPVIPSSNCPTGSDGYMYQYLNPESEETELRAYIDSVLAPVEDVNSMASIPNGCSNPVQVPGTSLFAVQVGPGIIDSVSLVKLNGLLSNSACGDGTTSKNPAVQFTPGIYRFNLSAAGTPRNLSGSNINTLLVNTNGIRVIGGVPKIGASGWECDTSKAGVQFQLQNGSYLSIGRGNIYLCPITASKPTVVAPWTASNVAPFSWSGSRTDPIIENTMCGSAGAGASSTFYSAGQIFTPSSYVKLCFNGNALLTLEKGLVAKAATVSVTNSAKSSGAVAPPRPYNGDRVIQLRFWSETRKQNLGILQVVIRDYFGRRQGSGYKVIAWRTIW